MKKRNIIALCLLFTVGLLLAYGPVYRKSVSATAPGVNHLVSQDSSGNWANGNSYIGVKPISHNGRYVVFTSDASNLVPNDTNNVRDVFLRDTQLGTTTRVSVTDTGAESSIASYSPSISYSGQYIVFHTDANLVSGVPTGVKTYIKDTVANTLSFVATGLEPDVSADGRFVSFSTNNSTLLGYTSSFYKPVVYDRQTSTARALFNVSVSGGASYLTMNCSGNVFSFSSAASGLPGALSPNPYPQKSVQYAATVGFNTAQITALSSSNIDIYNFTLPQISCDGNTLAYSRAVTTYSANTYNRITGLTTKAGIDSTGAGDSNSSIVSVSDNGRYVAFSSKVASLDTSYNTTYRGSNYDIFVRDTKTSQTSLVSFTALSNLSGRVPKHNIDNGAASTPITVRISGDGSTVVYLYDTPDVSNANSELISGVHSGTTDVYTSKTGF